jgi:adenine-specific DNA methylase
MKERPIDLRPASRSRVVPCPKCGAGWPVVQAMWEVRGKERRLVCCCTHCGIMGDVERKATR